MAGKGTKRDLIAYALKRAPSDPDKAEDVLQFFCEAIEMGDVPQKEILEYLATCFRGILSGKDAASALGVKSTKGKRRGRTLERIDERDLQLACAVARLRKVGMTRTNAIGTVADDGVRTANGQTLKASDSIVKKAYETYRRIADELTS